MRRALPSVPAPDGTEQDEPAAPAVDVPDSGPSGPLFWIGLALGAAIMAYAVWGAVQAFDPAGQIGLVRWLVGSAVVHDALLAPTVTVIGLALAWLLPRRVRGPIVGAAAISGVVVLFSWPALRGYELREANPSLLPHDYGRNVALVLAAVWAIAIPIVAIRARRGRASGSDS